MTKTTTLIAVTLASAISFPLAAQNCKTDSIEPSIEAEQLIDNRDGTVTDAKTGLTWAQCSLGQEWSAAGCSGDPENFWRQGPPSQADHDWGAALQAASQFNHNGGLAGEADWRIPNIKELASITERQCHEPSINVEYFPETPSAAYLSSTIEVTNGGDVMGGRAISFKTGSDIIFSNNKKRHVRLVRNN